MVHYGITTYIKCLDTADCYHQCGRRNAECTSTIKGLSQIVPGTRTASKNYYLSHLILLAVRAPGLICESPLKGLSQIVPGARTASKNCYLSHIILHTVRAPGTIYESPLTHDLKSNVNRLTYKAVSPWQMDSPTNAKNCSYHMCTI